MTLSIGLSVNPQDPRWLELAREAERVGVDSIWVPEFWAYDAFTPLAAIAARTERVRLVTGIAQLGARTPAMLVGRPDLGRIAVGLVCCTNRRRTCASVRTTPTGPRRCPVSGTGQTPLDRGSE